MTHLEGYVSTFLYQFSQPVTFTFVFDLFKFPLVFTVSVIFIKGTIFKSLCAYIYWQILTITVSQPAFHFVISCVNSCFLTYMYLHVYVYTRSVRNSIDGGCLVLWVISVFFLPLALFALKK